MTTRTLTVWAAQNAPAPDATGPVYRWNGYEESEGIHSLFAYVDRHGDRLRAAYVDWVQGLGEIVVEGQRVIDHLVLPDGLSYWWMTLFLEQSPWKSPAILDAIRLLAIGDIVRNERPGALRLVGGDSRLDASLRSWCGERGIAYSWTGVAPTPRRGLRDWYRALPRPVQAYLTIARYAVERWSLRERHRHLWSDDPRAVFFVSYFLHLDKRACDQGHFVSRYWEALPGMLHEAGIRTNWLQYYLQSSTVPNTQVAKDWLAAFNREPAAEGAHRFLDAFLSPAMLLRVARGLVRLAGMARRVGEFGSSYRPTDGPPLWPVMRDDWLQSMRGSTATINLFWLELYDAALAEAPYQRAGLYLMENQSWERAFLHAWRKHGHGTSIAVSQSTVRYWDVRYTAHPARFGGGPHALPQPDVVAVNGDVATEALRAMAYPDERLVETEALRYGNLEGLSGAARARADGAPLELLVVTDYHEAGTATMLRFLEDARPLLTQPVCITLKPHPNLMVEPRAHPTLDLTVVTDPLAQVLPRYDLVFASNNTSASVDAYVAGLPVLVSLDANDLNFSPLRGRPGVRFVRDAAALARALDEAAGSTMAPSAEAARFFYLDRTLPRWRRLLGLGTATDRPAAPGLGPRK